MYKIAVCATFTWIVPLQYSQEYAEVNIIIPVLQAGNGIQDFTEFTKSCSHHHWQLLNEPREAVLLWAGVRPAGVGGQGGGARVWSHRTGSESSFYTLKATGLWGRCWAERSRARWVQFSPRSNKLCQTAPANTPHDALGAQSAVWPWFFSFHFQHHPLCLWGPPFWFPKINGIYYGIWLTYVKRTLL